MTVIYPLGGGEKTVPSYDGQAIGKTIAEHIEAIGGTVTDSEKPDLVIGCQYTVDDIDDRIEQLRKFPDYVGFDERILGTHRICRQSGHSRKYR